jgi:hypothetical protein
MPAHLIEKASMAPVEQMIGPAGSIMPVPAAHLQSLPPACVQTYCHYHGVYQIPTLELMLWLARYAVGPNSLEICAGHGDIGRILGIRSTDSYMHLFPKVRRSYEAMGQPITHPPKRVEKFEALEAVRKYNPEVVVASWASEFGGYIEGRHTSPFGIHEREIWDHPSVQTYVVIGNWACHNERLPGVTPHETIEGQWLVSRAVDQKANFASVWKK